jgi:stress-induced morphogen
MPITKTELEATLLDAFPDATLTLNDEAGDNDHWNAVIVSKAFEGKGRLECHRMVHKAVEEKTIHALSFKTLVPEAK